MRGLRVLVSCICAWVQIVAPRKDVVQEALIFAFVVHLPVNLGFECLRLAVPDTSPLAWMLLPSLRGRRLPGGCRVYGSV